MSSPPTITTQPQSQLVDVNTAATFSVVATSSTPITYQWYFNCIIIPGATNSSYTINSVSNINMGLYYVIVSNGSGSTQSSNAVLTINNIPEIITQPLSQIVEYCDFVVFTVDTISATPLTYQWYFNNTAIPCAKSPIYEICSAQVSDSGTYYVIVTNSAGSVQSSNATLIVTVVPDTTPIICKQPKSKKVKKCDSVEICVGIEKNDSDTLKYQWYFDNKKIKCANSSAYEIEKFCKNDVGEYYVVVSNQYCSTTSDIAELTLCSKK